MLQGSYRQSKRCKIEIFDAPLARVSPLPLDEVHQLQSLKPCVSFDSRNLSLWSWNVRSLRKPGLPELLCSSLLSSKIDIACLQDTRLSGSGTLEFQQYSIWFCGHSDANNGSPGGVAIAISAKLVPSSYLLYCSDRLLLIRIRSKPFNIVVGFVYSPVDSSNNDESTFREFWNNLRSAIKDLVRRDDLLIIGGDFNCRLSRKLVPSLIGDYVYHCSASARSQYLTDFISEFNLAVSY